MDTTLMEYTAEDLIAHKLQRSGILVAKPKFDREGTDLIALKEVNDGARFCRIQCKGRSLINSRKSSVKIPTKYAATNSFILFIFIEDGSNDTHLYIFFKKDLEKWSTNDQNEYVVNFTIKNFKEKFEKFVFCPEKIKILEETIQSADVHAELHAVLPTIKVHMTGRTNIVYSDQTKEVRIEKQSSGHYSTIIRDKSTGSETIAASLLGDPQNSEYDPTTDTWTAKFRNL